MSDAQAGVVHVTIYDREYVLRTSGNPERLQNLCTDLDKRMREVAQASGSVDTLKVAILAALSIGDELLRAREEIRRTDESLSRRSKECVSMLDRFLHQ